jgi:hypothetical protein
MEIIIVIHHPSFPDMAVTHVENRNKTVPLQRKMCPSWWCPVSWILRSIDVRAVNISSDQLSRHCLWTGEGCLFMQYETEPIQHERPPYSLNSLVWKVNLDKQNALSRVQYNMNCGIDLLSLKYIYLRPFHSLGARSLKALSWGSAIILCTVRASTAECYGNGFS